MTREKEVDESWKDNAKKVELNEKDGPRIHVSGHAHSPVDEQEQSLQAGSPDEMTEHVHDENCQHDHGGDIEINFLNYVTSLGYQAMIFLGELPNPMTNESEKNLPQSKFLIDTLVMMREKTKGNLTEQERNLLDASIYELQMKYVENIQKKSD